MTRLRLFCLTLIGVLVWTGPVLARDLDRLEIESGPNSLSLRPWSGDTTTAYVLYVNKGGHKVTWEGNLELIKILESLLAGRGAEWPKTDKFGSFRFSRDSSKAKSIYVGRRRRHDTTIRMWITTDDLQQILAYCRKKASKK